MVRVAAETFRTNPEFDARQVIAEMGVGEALVSTLQADGTPSVVRRVLIKPPLSRIGPATALEVKQLLADSPCAGIYDDSIDRESAFEILGSRSKKSAEAAEANKQSSRKLDAPKPRKSGRKRQGHLEAFSKSMVRSLGSKAGRSLIRGLMGSLFKGR